tara:strand:+ start:901 stop:1725 length:825 start_codon:yes stop_codon:yes gene_type:complete
VSNSEILGAWEGKRYDYLDNQKSSFLYLQQELTKLRSVGVTGIKQSFEDEGVILGDVATMRRITESINTDIYVKIGGCEAITDINNCLSMGINSIIAPMVETKFALSKFLSAVKNVKGTNFYFVCETKTALENLEEMLDSDESGILSGIVVGRSDLTKSFDLPKKDVDSDFICEKAEKAFKLAKDRNLKTTMGGNISVSSVEFIKKMYSNGLLDKIETRNVVITLDEKNINSLTESITKSLLFEIDWLEFKASNYVSIGNAFSERTKVLKKRIE